MSFNPSRDLLNPKFEGYKLHAIEQENAVFSYPLPSNISQSTVSGRSFLSFQEVSSRIKHNHLAVGPNQRAVYIDSQWGVNLITLDEVDCPITSQDAS